MTTLDLTSFPERIRRIESEYRTRSGAEIGAFEVDHLLNAGNAVGGLFLRDCVAQIQIQKGLSTSERFQTICHEMLHLELSLRGYPLLEPLDNDDNAKNLAAHLESLLQHPLIMPVEKSELGYDPYVSEHKVADSLYKSFTQLTDFSSPTNSLWQFLYSAWGVSFARVATLAGDSVAFPKLKDFFKKPEMCSALEIARGLQQFIQHSDLTDPKKYTATLQTILHSHIQSNVINGTERIQIGSPCFP